ncbi:hypothetical protein MP228_006009 [Amoeboaphelidium protococcarum]|nr:hypothetical protein MP228_006009 [Amoeboaphelidium protococcarum]
MKRTYGTLQSLFTRLVMVTMATLIYLLDRSGPVCLRSRINGSVYARSRTKKSGLLWTVGSANCDLKPQNVLLDADANGLLVPILSDLGISSITDDSALLVAAFQVSWQRGLSLSYAAPELFVRFRSRYTETSPQILKAADVYALSIIMLNLITRDKPWSVKQRYQ